MSTQKVCQVITVPGASGGIAVDSAHRRTYVSGLPASRWLPTTAGLPGAEGDVVLVYRWGRACGEAVLDRVIPVPPQADPPTVQTFPPPRSGLAATSTSWPQRLAVSPDGNRLLVPLNLANSAAVIDLAHGDRTTYALAGSYPFGAAVLPGSLLGLVTNEASGTVSMINLRTARVLATIAVGPPLSHPQGVVVDRQGRRAYVALSASDQVVVIDLRKRRVERTISVGRVAGLGTMPVALALDPRQARLYVAESGADEVAVVQLPGAGVRKGTAWTVLGRIPTADQPQSVVTLPAGGARPASVAYLAAEGLGTGANPKGPDPLLASDPIFWAFNPLAPTTDVFEGVQYVPMMSRGRLGILPLPTDAQIADMTPVASQQLVPTNTQAAPKGTPLRANGPIRHVFFIVRENRSYDQLLGDVARGNGDPKLTLFGAPVTPNLHALVTRFPLLDNVYANSEASIQGHYWTASASVPDYVTRNWIQQYGGRGRPNDFGTYAVSWPGNGFLFDHAQRAGVSYFNYGEGFIGGYAQVPDRDRTPEQAARIAAVQANSDLGPPFGGCFPGDLTIGTALDGKQIFDSSLPAGAPSGSYSHVDCFRERFATQVAAGAVPALSYITLTSDHTRGTQPGFPVPTAMVADSDLAIGQIIDTISHSPVWASSAIFIIEDDSQDGADHVDAHRIPALVVSPYARSGAVVHTRYDLLSVVRSIELILGLSPLSINDALATPMYSVFSPTPTNLEPVTALVPAVDLLEQNTAASPDSMWSSRLELDKPDRVAQSDLDVILWHSVHGADSPPPPAGPNAVREADGD
jgi:YVTN family beta-propeller protein